jgi:RNA polymerase subunit RPABC4/transcription elongation factor Spt4
MSPIPIKFYGLKRYCPDCGRWLLVVNGNGTLDIAAQSTGDAEVVIEEGRGEGLVLEATCLRCHPLYEDDEDTCDQCGTDLADDEGEGYDGLCGNCADKAEAEGKWS